MLWLQLEHTLQLNKIWYLLCVQVRLKGLLVVRLGSGSSHEVYVLNFAFHNSTSVFMVVRNICRFKRVSRQYKKCRNREKQGKPFTALSNILLHRLNRKQLKEFDSR